MEYTLTVIDNIYTLTNNEVNAIYLKIEYQENCTNDFVTNIDNREVTTSTTFDLSKKDGIYRITLTHNSENIVLFIESYYNFFISMIDDIHYILCGCNDCDNCNDCDGTEKEYFSTILKILSYDILKKGIYTSLVAETESCIKCNILDINQCILLNENVSGNYDNNHLMKQIIAYYYLLIYYKDVDNSIIYPEISYNFKNIFKCIKKLGIDNLCIKEIII